jgi:hypothetical protein
MIEKSLIRIYEHTKFVVFAPPEEVVMRVGTRSEKLDSLMLKSAVTTCAFVTAWNPGSKRLPKVVNELRQRDLLAEAQKRNYVFLEGKGIGPDGSWEPEASILILGISREIATDLGRQFGQNAIVFANRKEPVELVLCAE